MPIVLKTPNEKIKADFAGGYNAKVRQVLINTLFYVGESCIREARDHGKYTDRTGNLRSSIGYSVVEDGVTLRDSAPQSFSGPEGSGAQGAENGKSFLETVKSSHNKGLVLIVTAGMNYAVYVEARGYNVLTSAELLADKLVPQLLKQIGFKVK